MFDIDAPQYTSPMKQLPRETCIFPARVLIPDSPKYKKAKPIPNVDTYVAVAGFMCRFDLTQPGNVKHFIIELDNVSFLGKRTAPLECKYFGDCLPVLLIGFCILAPATPSPASTSSTKTKLKFSFENSPRPQKCSKQLDQPLPDLSSAFLNKPGPSTSTSKKV
jgi:hypothetical protein